MTDEESKVTDEFFITRLLEDTTKSLVSVAFVEDLRLSKNPLVTLCLVSTYVLKMGAL